MNLLLQIKNLLQKKDNEKEKSNEDLFKGFTTNSINNSENH